jgi:hypothetical protein
VFHHFVFHHFHGFQRGSIPSGQAPTNSHHLVNKKGGFEVVQNQKLNSSTIARKTVLIFDVTECVILDLRDFRSRDFVPACFCDCVFLALRDFCPRVFVSCVILDLRDFAPATFSAT